MSVKKILTTCFIVVFSGRIGKWLVDAAAWRYIPEGIVAVSLHNGTGRIRQGDDAVQSVGMIIRCYAPPLHGQRFIDVEAVGIPGGHCSRRIIGGYYRTPVIDIPGNNVVERLGYSPPQWITGIDDGIAASCYLGKMVFVIKGIGGGYAPFGLLAPVA